MQAGLLLSSKNSITENLRCLWRIDQAIPWVTACRTVMVFWTTYRGDITPTTIFVRYLVTICRCCWNLLSIRQLAGFGMERRRGNFEAVTGNSLESISKLYKIPVLYGLSNVCMTNTWTKRNKEGN